MRILFLWIFGLNVCFCNHTLLFNTPRSIFLLREPKKVTTVVKDLPDATAIDFFYKDSLVCWSDHYSEEIACENTTSETPRKITYAKNYITTANGIACDWLTKKIYWTECGTNSEKPSKIEVVSLETKYRTPVYWKELDQIRGIAVDPTVGLLFWSDWGNVPKLERGSMNGDPTLRKVIVSERLFWPNGVTLDVYSKKVFWVDGQLKLLEVTDYNGENRQILGKDNGLSYPYGISFADDRIYWSDWEHRGVFSFDMKNDVSKVFSISEKIPNSVDAVWDVKVYETRRQPYVSTPCEKDNGGCSHLCLLSSGLKKYSCACSTGIKLIDNQTCATHVDQFLLVVQWPVISIVSLDTSDYTNFELPLTDLQEAVGIDYDPIEEYFYWTDDGTRDIRRAKSDGTKQEIVLSKDVYLPDGITIDWVARHIYWSDKEAKRIEMLRLHTPFRKTIIFDDIEKPRAVAVSPRHAWLFWTDFDDNNPKIERTELDGANRQPIVKNNIVWPNGLALDPDNEKVYWGDAKTDKIEVVNMHGRERREVVSDNLSHLFGLSLLGDYLYWTDGQRRTVERMNKNTGSDRIVILDEKVDVMSLKAARRHLPLVPTPCSTMNGNCDQFCINKPDNNSVCMCQIEYELVEKRKCVISTAFMLLFSNNCIRKMSISNTFYSDVVSSDRIPIVKIKSISALDMDVANNRLYWADSKAKKIKRAFLNGSRIEDVVGFGVVSPESLAIDWLSSNLYWADAGTKRIEVTRLDGRFRKTLFWKNLTEPRHLVLDPRLGYMFWSDWSSGTSTITKAAMDGSGKNSIVSDIGRVNGLTIDYTQRYLFWTQYDNEIGSIEVCNADGKNRRRIISRAGLKPNAIAQYQDFVYWTNWSNTSVMLANKHNGQNLRILNVGSELIEDLRIIDASKQTGWNACHSKNVECKNLCLVRPGFSEESTEKQCACPTHFTMVGNMCLPPENYLLFSQKNAVYRLTTHMEECPDVALQVPGFRLARAIQYDPVSRYVYWIEGKEKNTTIIRRSSETESHSVTVVGNNNSNNNVISSNNNNNNNVNIEEASKKPAHFYDIALEPYSKLLFWSCAWTDLINVTRANNLTGGTIFIATNGEKPRNLALHPERGLLFWTDLGEKPGIVQSRLNGAKQTFIHTEGRIVDTLTVDRATNSLFYSSGDMLYMHELYENRTISILSLDTKATHLAIIDSFLYWISKDANRIERINKTTGDGRMIIVENMPHLTGIIAVPRLDDQYRLHPCSVHNHYGNCSHICLRSIENQYKSECACPIGMKLNNDNRTCLAPPPCGPDHWRCATLGGECIPLRWKCDGHLDCPDSSDEVGCDECDKFHHKCSSTICVKPNKVCDGVEDCEDGSDEILCNNRNHLKNDSSEDSSGILLVSLALCVIFVCLGAMAAVVCSKGSFKRSTPNDVDDIIAMRALVPNGGPQIVTRAVTGLPHSMTNGGAGSSGSYDRSYITGASSSISVNLPLNPPPSPTTTHMQEDICCERYSLTPHPTPCSTVVCDESDATSLSNSYRKVPEQNHHRYRSKSMKNWRPPMDYYEDEICHPVQPPPTPRSHSSETSPSSSVYFHKLLPGPPPPSPTNL